MRASKLAQALAIVLAHDPDAELCIHGGKLWLPDSESLSMRERQALAALGFRPEQDSLSSSRWTA